MTKLNKIISEARQVPKVVITFRNWWVYFFNIFGSSTGEKVCKLRNGSKFIVRSNSFDIRMIKEVYIHKPYHRLEINRGDIVVDIGAHIGTFSIMAGQKTGETGKVYAFEPVPDTFDLLKRNIQINSLQNNIQPYKMGISNKGGKKEFYIFKKDGKPIFHSTSLYKEQLGAIDANTSEKFEVECITLKDIFQSNGLDGVEVLKMDCEGVEYDLLFNTPKEYLKRIDRMCIEYHDYLSTSYNHKDIIDYLSKLEYEVFLEVPKNSEAGCGIIYAWKRAGKEYEKK